MTKSANQQKKKSIQFGVILLYYSKWNRQAYGLLHLRIFATHFLSKQFFSAFFCARHHLCSIIIKILEVMRSVIVWSRCAKEKHKIQMMIFWPFYCERCRCFNQIVYCVYLTLSANYLAFLRIFWLHNVRLSMCGWNWFMYYVFIYCECLIGLILMGASKVTTTFQIEI